MPLAKPLIALQLRFRWGQGGRFGLHQDLAAAGEQPRAIHFTGNCREYLPIAARNALLIVCTLGVYRFWGARGCGVNADAIQSLKRAGIDPRPTAQLFRRLSKESPEFTAEFLQSHPLSEKRAGRFAASLDPHAHYRPALNRDQADALFGICSRPRSK